MDDLLRPVRDERGAALLIASVSLTAVLGMMALAVDLSMVYAARGEAQRAADAAALAGASAFVDAASSVESEARRRAADTARRNTIQGEPVRAREIQVTVEDQASVVRVRVERTALPTMFARVLGVERVAVSATAAAHAIDAPSASCVKPFSPPDPEASGSGGSTARRRGGRGPQGGGGGGGNGGGDGGYRHGQSIVLKGSGGAGESMPWVVPAGRGSTGPCSEHGAEHAPPMFQANICNCNRSTVELNRTYQLVSGWRGGLREQTERGVERLLRQDPHARWDGQRGIVGSEHSNWRRSPRVIAVPLHDPASPPGRLRFTRFAWAFVESEDNGTVSGRYLGPVRVIQLVE